MRSHFNRLSNCIGETSNSIQQTVGLHDNDNDMHVEGIKLAALVAYILASCLACQASAQLSCVNEQGKPVDWFIAYKFPKLSGDKLFNKGLAYSYITSEEVKESNIEDVGSESSSFLHRISYMFLRYCGIRAPRIAERKGYKQLAGRASDNAVWQASERAISDPESIIMRTLAVAYDNSTIDTVFYNDDPTGTSAGTEDGGESEPEEAPEPNIRRAHAKGALLMDEHSGDGVWLTHSVPRFPNTLTAPLLFPYSGTKNGQTFMCISFKLSDAGKKIVDHLVNMEPLVYEHRISTEMYSKIPGLKNLDLEKNRNKNKHKRLRAPVMPKIFQTITTKGGQSLELFAKSTSFNADMYAGWIDEVIGSDMFVETWRNGRGGTLNSSCPRGDYHINNVKDLKYNKMLQWSYLKDHSKWAISESQEVGVVCIGDSNRMASQFKRGGGAVCIKCPKCWNVFSNTIQDVEPCPIGKQKRLDKGDTRSGAPGRV